MTELNRPEPGAGRALGLGGAVLDDAALAALLQRVVLLARHTLTSAASVSITIGDNGGFRTSNSTGEIALAIDQAQYDEDDGPCLQAMRSMKQVRFAVGTEARWARLEEEARAADIAAVLSTPLMGGPGETIGALNVYANSDDVFGDAEAQTAEIIAEHAAILVGNTLELQSATQLNEQMREAVASREIIGEAKGIIMERQGCNRDEAFDVLRRASQRENRKLRDLAEQLVARVEARGGQAQPPQ